MVLTFSPVYVLISESVFSNRPHHFTETLKNYFNDTKTTPEDYDIVYTGDLGHTGTELLYELMIRKGMI